jgi:hypothetical protein
MSDLRRPPRLAVFLAVGGDLAGVYGLDRLAEDAVGTRRLLDEAARREQANTKLGWAEEYLANPQMLEQYGDPQGELTMAFWSAEVLADDALAIRVESMLPGPMVAFHLAAVEAEQRPYVVRWEERPFACGACGELYANDPALVILGRLHAVTGDIANYPNLSDIPPLTFCRGCVTAAVDGT